MTINSYLCNFMMAFPSDWKERCQDKKIKIKEKNGLFIFNYDIGADFYDPIVQEARGIIIDADKLEVVCWPFRKFGNYTEPYADDIDWSSSKVQEKIDGSIVKLWYRNEWRWSTNSCIDAGDAHTQSGVSFQKLIDKADIIPYGALNTDHTYIFELVGPENQVVIKYPKAMLYHIGTRNNRTGKEINIDIGIKKPKEYPIRSLEECVRAVKELNNDDYPDMEGFVVVDKDYNRIKVKSPEYLLWHHAVNNGNMTKDIAYDLFFSDDFSYETFKSSVPEHILDKYNFYAEEFNKAFFNIKQTISEVREIKNLPRKEIAEHIKDNPYKYYGFKALDRDDNADDLITDLGKNVFLKAVPEYEEDYEEEREI